MVSGQAENTASLSWRDLFTTDAMRRLVITIAALLVYRLGATIPAPGLTPEGIPGLGRYFDASTPQVLHRFSLFSLGLGPVFSIVIAAEVLKLAAPGLRTWLNRGTGQRSLFNRCILATALVLVAFQAYGITIGLEGLQGITGPLVPAPGIGFRLQYVLTLIAGTALLMWLADQITRHGIGSGFWIILLVPTLNNLADLPETLSKQLEIGQITIPEIAWFSAAVVAAVALIAGLYRSGHSDVLAQTGEDTQSVSAAIVGAILWPPIIGLALTRIISASASSFLTSLGLFGTQSEFLSFGSLFSMILTVSLIFLVSKLIVSFVTTSNRTLDTPEFHRFAWIAVLATSAICVALEIILSRYPIAFIEGGWFTAIALVCLSMLPNALAQYFPDPPPLSDDDASGSP
jgi:preprotein translocase subunit SecY